MDAETRTKLAASVRQRFLLLDDSMDERVRRHWAGSEAEVIGRGGIAIVANATGIGKRTIGVGRGEVRTGERPDDLVRVRRAGGGRMRHEEIHPELLSALKALVDPATRGDPESPLKWSSKSTQKLSDEMWDAYEIRVGKKTVGRLLRDMDYSLQGTQKTVEGKQHPDRNAQFEHINAKATDCIERGVPFISVDTKKKELVGNFKNAGREWQPSGDPERVRDKDFPNLALGKAIPYGVLDVADNSGFVAVGTDHDTPKFAVKSIETWWLRYGSKRYPGACDLFITADAGGSNGHRPRLWKAELQRLADKHAVAVHVSHFPPGTSKWNKIEHRLFAFITINWRGRPLRTYKTVVNLIGSTATEGGLVVRATLDGRKYPIGQKVSNAEMKTLNIERDSFHGDWNYVIRPRARP